MKPQLGISYLAMNHDRPLFKGAKGTDLAKAINYAIDRKAMLAQGGYLAGKRTDQVLPPGIAGFRDANLYPLKGPDLSTAKKWAAKAGVKTGQTVEYYTSNTGSAPLVAQILQFNLKQIGINVNTHLFARAVQIEKEGTRGEPFDITSEAWIADYADPYDFINVLLSGDNLHASNNNNVAYFNDPKYNKQMRTASLLSGAARYKAYGNLDVYDDAEQPAVGGPLELQRPRCSSRSVSAASRSTRSTASTWLRSASSSRRAESKRFWGAPSRGAPAFKSSIQTTVLNTDSTNHSLKSPRLAQVSSPPAHVGVRAVRRSHDRHLRDLYAIPADPARLACGQRATAECIKRAAHYLGTDRPLYVQYGKFFGRLMPVAGLPTDSPALQDAEPRPFVHEPPERQLRRDQRCARHRFARVRRRGVLDVDRVARRDPLGAATAIVARPNSHGVRPHRDQCAPGVDRPAARLLLRLQGWHLPDHRLLRLHQPLGRAAVGRSSGPTT